MKQVFMKKVQKWIPLAVCGAVVLYFFARFVINSLSDDGVEVVPVGPAPAIVASHMDAIMDTKAGIFATATGGVLSDRLPVGPIATICGVAGVFYDPVVNKITLPAGVAVEDVSYNTARYLHTITLSGVDLTRDNRLFLLYNHLVVNIAQDGQAITIRTHHPAHITITDRYIQIQNLRDIYHTIVLIDPGHGGVDTGAPNVLGRNYPSEADIVLAISNKLLATFDAPGVLLIPTRTTDVAVDNGYRYRTANRVADYFISIHNNACGVSSLSDGILTMYGYNPAGYYLANIMQAEIVTALGRRDRGVVESLDFRILLWSDIPTVILEILFISNPAEARLLVDAGVQQQIADAIGQGIAQLQGRRASE